MIRRIAPIALVAGLVACAQASPVSDQPAPSPDQASITAAPTPSATSVVAASPTPSEDDSAVPSPATEPTRAQYKGGDIVEVLAGGLAVRQGPGTAYTLLDAARWGGGAIEVLGSPYRLSAGEQLVIGRGPLAIGGRDWYGVMHTDDEIQWTPPGDPESGNYGWIAAKDEGAEFVRLVTEASDLCCFWDRGVGPATTATVPTLPVPPSGGLRGFTLTVGHADPAGSCHVLVTDDTGQVLLDDTIVGWGNPGAWWGGEGDRLTVDTQCSWSLSVGISQG